MAKLFNITGMTTSTTGTDDLLLDAAVAGCNTFAAAGVQDGDLVSYGIIDGNLGSEVGRGTYSSTGPTLTRDTVLASTNGGSKLNLSGNAQVFITVLAQDLGPGQVLFTAEGVLGATGTVGKLRLYNTSGDMRVITQVSISINTPPTGQPVIADIHKNGVTIFSDQGHRPQVSPGTYYGVSGVVDDPYWDNGDYLTMDIDQVGNGGENGRDVVVHVTF